jgi:hypothetical protein
MSTLTAPVRLTVRRFGETSRSDAWWIQPLVVFLALSTFVVYSTWAAFQGDHYTFGPYLSPFYSPEIFGDPATSWFGAKPAIWPPWLPFSPALLILPFPALFRFTCYYYRGAYYKAFWADPLSCTVGEPRKSYLGENSFPLILQNVHRYFMLIALLFLIVLSYDVWKALWFVSPGTGQTTFGIGVGTLVLAANVVLLSLYTFSCHSLRHLIGGCNDCVSQTAGHGGVYTCVSALNRKHMLFAWMSLVVVGFSDLYVRLCSMNVWTDYRIL